MLIFLHSFKKKSHLIVLHFENAMQSIWQCICCCGILLWNQIHKIPTTLLLLSLTGTGTKPLSYIHNLLFLLLFLQLPQQVLKKYSHTDVQKVTCIHKHSHTYMHANDHCNSFVRFFCYFVFLFPQVRSFFSSPVTVVVSLAKTHTTQSKHHTDTHIRPRGKHKLSHTYLQSFIYERWNTRPNKGKPD